MVTVDFEIFRMAFDYAQRHRFAQMGKSVEEIHLVGADGNIDPIFEGMVKSVYKCARQAWDRVQQWQAAGFPPV
jgi:hypothetical protein